MSKSTTTNIADDTVSFLADGDFEIDFTVKRVNLPVVHIDELATVQVFVIPRGRETILATRNKKEKHHKIEVGIQKHLTSINDATEVDPIAYFVEQIEDYLLGETFQGATCVEVQNILADDSIFAKDHIQMDRVYTSVLVATFVEI